MITSPVGHGARSAQQVLAQVRAVVEPAHRAAVDRLPPSIRHICGYHVGWWDAGGRPGDDGGGGGKAIRQALVLAFSVGPSPAPAAVEAAVAVELVHDFSLLHDDVMDGDLTRRHRPTVWSVFGVGEAILAGDMLLALAADLLADRAGLKVLTGAVLDLCAGQSADLAFEERADVTLVECTAMAQGKTGALLGAACELGAVAAGADGERAAVLNRFGRQLGMAFQLVDDLLGIWGDPQVTGKPVYSDLARRKKSLPVVAALSSGTPAGEHLGWLYHQDTTLDGPALAHAANLIEDAGGRAWAQGEADRQMRQALASLREACPRPEAAADLTALAHLITRRDH